MAKTKNPPKPSPAPAKSPNPLAGSVLEYVDLPDQLLNQMWVVAQGVGLGANRHLGYGRFEVANIQQIADWNIADLFRPSTGNGANGHNGMSPVPQTVDAVSGTPAGGAD